MTALQQRHLRAETARLRSALAAIHDHLHADRDMPTPYLRRLLADLTVADARREL